MKRVGASSTLSRLNDVQPNRAVPSSLGPANGNTAELLPYCRRLSKHIERHWDSLRPSGRNCVQSFDVVNRKRDRPKISNTGYFEPG
jgi:hypothetical protein